ncbi:MAG: NAD-dependent epimerase/dehydratase family protein [Maritimibacter sp.]|nr:NAD-dependent epimerase/dehydratase family protein [Maritimibacter sp.]
MTQTVLILGASGKIGTHAARAFAAAGWQVRKFNRKTDDMIDAARGCDVIVNGMNPPNYHDWARIIPRITAEVIAAARASGATVIVPGNVYVYGDHPGTWSEATPHRPNTRKGRIRAAMERAYAESGVPTILLRGGDFIDPDRNGDVLSTVNLRALGRGKVTALGPTGARHAYVWLPDWARAAVMLAERRDRLATYEEVNMPGYAVSIDEITAELARQTGRTLRIGQFPWWVMRLAAPAWELARELGEMRYLWTVPHSLSGEKFTRLLPEFEPTPFAEAMRGVVPPAQGRAPGRATQPA